MAVGFNCTTKRKPASGCALPLIVAVRIKSVSITLLTPLAVFKPSMNVLNDVPLGEGIVLDTFAGAGSTLAAAIAVGYDSIGVEIDPAYVALAQTAIPKLATIPSSWPSTSAVRRSRRLTPSD